MAFVTGSLVLLAIALLVVGGAALSLYKDLAWRACAVEGLGVLAAMGRAYRVMRAHLKDVSLVWVISLAARWAWRLALIPVVIALVGVALLTGSLPALLTGGLTSLVASGDLPVFLALGVGVPVFLVVLVAPLLLAAGLREVFVSTLWTLSYRELRPLEGQATPASGQVGRAQPGGGASCIVNAGLLDKDRRCACIYKKRSGPMSQVGAFCPSSPFV